MKHLVRLTALGLLLGSPSLAFAQASPTPGFAEPVMQWNVQKGETCESIAKILYGSPSHAPLVQRYNRVACGPRVELPEGTTLVLPASVTSLPDARVRSMKPDVRVRPAGGAWAPAASGAPLYTNYNVNTLDKARADIEFVDRTRIFLASNTLVVIYGTASRTRVSKTPPPAVELDSGEIKAGLAALRGDGQRDGQHKVEIAVKGGGTVSAESRDAVVERKGERTTVAVFDGKASVRSSGKAVAVPKNFGTRFVGVKPPDPPRPLPPAPLWEAGGSGAVVLASPEGALLNATWKPEPSATLYRFEVARDEAFRDLVVREEVPASVLSLRAEKMPPGTYYLAVRAIDKEEYLGVASQVRAVKVVATRIDAGSLGATGIEANPYAVLSLEPTPGVEMAIDEGPFSAVMPSVDLRRRAPKTLRFRTREGAPVQEIPVRYTTVGATIEALPAGAGRALAPGEARVRVTFEGLAGIDIAARVAPSLRVHLPGGARAVALKQEGPDVARASFKAPEGVALVRVDVVDGRGAVIGTADVAPAKPPPKPPAGPPEPPPRLGVTAPMLLLAPGASVAWWSPTAEDAFSAGLAAGFAEEGSAESAAVRASGGMGRFGLDAAIGFALAGERAADSSAWLGGRARVLRLGRSAFELGGALRFGVPVADGEAPARIEPALAAGGAAGNFTWLVNAGVRVRLGDDPGPSEVPAAQTFAIVGATFDPLPWLRTYASLDGAILHGVYAETLEAGRSLVSPSDHVPTGGFTLGVEAGRAVFGGLSARFSPYDEAGQRALSGQVTVGFRAE